MHEGLGRLAEDGFVLLEGVFSPEQLDEAWKTLGAALDVPGVDDPTMRGAGGVYGARNLLQLWPESRRFWRQPALREALRAVLGPCFGLVRGLYFDKPPGQTWALPWHKDLTIAVADNALPSAHFRKPTRKSGVPHIEAPCEILEAMITARIHLDDVTEENGPLRVIPGSHRTGKTLDLGDLASAAIHARRGDVLLMRPLLAHASGRSQDDTRRHRRIVHLEFAATAELPDGFAWHEWIPENSDL